MSRPVSPNTSLRLQGLAQARRTLAQASSLRLGESSTFSIRTLHAFSLRPNPPRLSETFARSKVQRVVWATVRGEMLRRAPVNLALTRQARLGEFNRPRHCSSLPPTHNHAQTIIQIMPYTHSDIQARKS